FAAQHRARALGERERLVFAFGAQVAERDQLAQHSAPARLAHRFADRERAEPLVTKLRDLVGALAAQHVDQVAGAEARAAGLLEAVDARERHPRGLGRIPRRRRLAAVVARVLLRTAGRARFAEVREQADAAAIVGLGEREQRV